MSIKNNTTSLQDLLEQVNSLPTAENLDTELSVQTTLLSEQDSKIAQLAEILAGKAGGNGGAEIETVIGTLTVGGFFLEEVPLYYLDKNLNLQCVDASTPQTIEVVKNSIICSPYGFSSANCFPEDENVFPLILFNPVTCLAAYVSDNFTLEFTS